MWNSFFFRELQSFLIDVYLIYSAVFIIAVHKVIMLIIYTFLNYLPLWLIIGHHRIYHSIDCSLCAAQQVLAVHPFCVQNLTFAMDMKVILQSVGAVLKGSGSLSGDAQTVADLDAYRREQVEKGILKPEDLMGDTYEQDSAV